MHAVRSATLLAVGLLFFGGACSGPDSGDETDHLIPDLDRSRTERLEVMQGRFITPEGFSVEHVATLGSVVNMTFDHRGRPAMSTEHGGILLLDDEDGDGRYESEKVFCDDVQMAHGMYYIGPGDLLVNSEGPQGTGLYRVTDVDGDDEADNVILIARSCGPIREHGPHAIFRGPDGYYYVLYGNHSHPDVRVDPDSPVIGLQEDHLLPRYVDPRGHANHIRAPAGTIHRLSPDLTRWSRIEAGFRNPFDMAADISGEIFTFDSDMEWDFGLPWFRPIRVIHSIPGGDYGWRTGSSKFPFYYIDTLPSVDDLGRGSPVGIAFYYHHRYPEEFYGALFMGDWSRGRIRVVFPKRAGATYEGKTGDFVLGEPLNVTDLDIGPGGFLYFSIGGRSTTGGLYRVRYSGDRKRPEPSTGSIEGILNQPMPRSAWGRTSLSRSIQEIGDDWEAQVEEALLDEDRSTDQRLRALELLQMSGTKPDRAFLSGLARDSDPLVRAGSILLLGTASFEQARDDLIGALSDTDPFVVRRACEALIRAGLTPKVPFSTDDTLPLQLHALLDHEDRVVRYAARLVLSRVDPSAWVDLVAADEIERRPRGALEGTLALIYTQSTPQHGRVILSKLDEYSTVRMNDDTMLRYLRVLQLGLIRFDSYAIEEEKRQTLCARIGPRLLEQFPSSDTRVNRELQLVLSYMKTPGAIDAILAYLTPGKSQQEQIHTVYALRAIDEGWTQPQRRKLVDWFDRAWKFRGAASMSGYTNNLWESTLALLPEEERVAAEARRLESVTEMARQAAELAASVEGDEPERSNLSQMSFEEIADFLEYDPMSYEYGSAARGRKIFYRARCVNCHVFGNEGRGGGPDLSTVVKRFRRREILESIMYPSKVISDQYVGISVKLDGEFLSGMLAGESDSHLTLINASGDRIDVSKAEIVERGPSDVSIMPEGLLDVMSLQELVDLMLFLEKGSAS